MPENPTPEEHREADSASPEAAPGHDKENDQQNDTGEFITRQIFDRDTVFFEG
jgi:hypothetical protein